MDVRCFVCFTSSDQVESLIDGLGIKYTKWPAGAKESFTARFDIAESDPLWSSVAKLIETAGLTHGWYTVFTRREILTAEWLALSASREQGYPQPERGMRWQELALSPVRGCRKCGVGQTQLNSFRIKKEPSLSNRGLGPYGFMHLFWASGIFAVPQVFESFAAAGLRGYEKWPAIIHSAGEPAKNIAQIYVPQETEPGLLSKDLVYETCARCGQVKYNRVTRGSIKYRRDALPVNLDFVRTHEWFGSGGFALQEIVVTNRVARLLMDRGWKSAKLAPLEVH